jgi:signal transduction histidine kinase
MEPGAGLGGLARQELRAVRTINYAEDSRLQRAPVRETLDEGLHSAMCAPLLSSGDSPLGLLYAASRTLTPFTESDTALLTEFASFAAMSIQETEAEHHRLAVMQKLEQERLAFKLHDSLVRDLMEIGFTAEAGLAAACDSVVRNQLEAIGRTAELCLEKVREEITGLVAESDSRQAMPVAEVIQQLRMMHTYGRVERSFTVKGPGKATLPTAIANALISIGQEAIENAERHSSGTRVEVIIEVEDEAAVIRVSDNGAGAGSDVLEASATEKTCHLGLRHMRHVARRLSGSLTIQECDGGGVVVESRLPMTQPLIR